MKKVLFYVATALALLVSCNKQENSVVSEEYKTYSLKAKVENFFTKGTYDADGKYIWAEGDKIGVYMTDGSSSWTEPLTIKAGDGGKTEATFTTARQIPPHSWGTFAYYPWNGWNNDTDHGTNLGGDGNTIYFNLKYENNFSNDSNNAQHLIPLLASIEDNATQGIEFKQIAAGIKVSLKNVPAHANNVRLTIPGKKIVGWFTIGKNSAGTGSLSATDSENDNTVVIKFSQSESVRDMSFVFPIPTLSLSALTVGLYNDSVLMWSKSASTKTPTVLSRGDVLSMPEFTVPSSSGTKTINVGIISYLFNDSNFDSGNCKVRYWGGLNDEGDATLKATDVNSTKSVGSNYWSGAEQTFTMYTATVPADITGFKVYDSTHNRWFGDDADQNTTSAYIFNYSGDKAYYE